MKNASFFLLILSMLFLSSCFYIQVEYPPERGRTPLDEFHKSVPFSPGGTLSLANVNGNVEIHGWEREELEVYAEKMIQLPDRTKFYVYPRKDFAPGIVFDKFENFIKIRTKNVSENKEIGFVDYFIDVPRSINLKDIVVRNGNMYISGVCGDAYLDLTEGDITVENTSAHLVAAFPDGEISSEFEIDVPPDDKKIDTQWGENGPRISLTALRGNIRITKVTWY